MPSENKMNTIEYGCSIRDPAAIKQARIQDLLSHRDFLREGYEQAREEIGDAIRHNPRAVKWHEGTINIFHVRIREIEETIEMLRENPHSTNGSDLVY